MKTSTMAGLATAALLLGGLFYVATFAPDSTSLATSDEAASNRHLMRAGRMFTEVGTNASGDIDTFKAAVPILRDACTEIGLAADNAPTMRAPMLRDIEERCAISVRHFESGDLIRGLAEMQSMMEEVRRIKPD
ncbi:MAG: hypothetical protein OXI55_14605 [Gammaproteobacteria bacterium]|nr:hypothetical protein [Gammaproteobacteria bacterium]